MLQIDDMCDDMLHLGILRPDETAEIDLHDDADLAEEGLRAVHDIHDSDRMHGPHELGLNLHEDDIEVEPADEHVEMVLDMEGVGIDDPVRMYLREIGRVSLLTAGHEVALAKRMESGLALGKRMNEMRRNYGFVPPAEVVCLELYEALVHYWPGMVEIYKAQYGERPPLSRHKLMSAISPADNIDPAVIRSIAMRELIPTERL